jgi:hypothetical protein
MRRFIKTHESVIKLIKPFVPNWYVPIHLGGFGIDPKLAPGPVVMTSDQRQVASYFIFNPAESLYVSSGIEIPSYMGKHALLRVVLLSAAETEYRTSQPLVPLALLRDSWLERFAYIARISGGYDEGLRAVPNSHIGDSYFNFSDVRYDQKKIEEFFIPRFYAIPTVDCPPLRLLRLPISEKGFSSDRHWKSWLHPELEANVLQPKFLELARKRLASKLEIEDLTLQVSRLSWQHQHGMLDPHKFVPKKPKIK